MILIEVNCKKFAHNVKKYREQRGYNKGRLSELVGCDISYIGKIERSEKYPKDAEVSTTFIYPLLDEEYHTVKDMPDEVCEEIAQEFIEIVGKINNLEFDRPEKCPNSKFCSYKNLCKMNAI